MDQTRQKALIAVLGLVFSATAAAWDGSDCADATDRLRQAASDAADAGEELLSSPSRSALGEVRDAISEVESILARARSECGMRAAAAPARDGKITQEQALRQIERWTERMKKTDPRYATVETVLLKHVDYVIKGMPPQYWLPTLQLMYGATADAAATAPKVPARPGF